MRWEVGVTPAAVGAQILKLGYHHIVRDVGGGVLAGVEREGKDHFYVVSVINRVFEAEGQPELGSLARVVLVQLDVPGEDHPGEGNGQEDQG